MAPGLQVKEINFNDIDPNKEGIVLLGAGGDLREWINGVTDMLNKEGMVQGSPNDLWAGAYALTTQGGRTDLVLPFKPGSKINIGKLAMWRLRFGDCSWISDYVENYNPNRDNRDRRGPADRDDDEDRDDSRQSRERGMNRGDDDEEMSHGAGLL